MRIFVRVKPNSKKEKIEKIGENEFALNVNAPAKEGRANERVLELLSEYFNVAKSKIAILKGNKSKNKMIELLP